MNHPVGRVSALWRYPVKSMLGEAVSALDVEPRGAVADRLFAVRDANGKFGSGKTTRRFQRIDGLFGFHARRDGESVMIRLPDGSEISGSDPAVHAALSAALGQRVTLSREAAISHFDDSPLHLVTSAGLRWLAARLPDSTIDVRRFRPNIVIEVGAAAAPVEDGWIDAVLDFAAGLRVQIRRRAERCVMITNPQSELVADPPILRELAAVSDACFGVYAQVVEPGAVRLGDEVSLTAAIDTGRSSPGGS
jgi:uncharacterized protein YcbX